MGVKFTYNNLDWVIPWYLDDYLSLNDQQEKSFDSQLEALWLWHRENELSDYSDFLHQIIIDFDNQDVTEEKLKSYSVQTSALYKRLISKSLEVGTPLISSLSDQQVSDLLDSIADNDKDFKEEVAETDQQERIKDRRKSVAKTFRKWLGRLSKYQKKRIQTWSEEAKTTLEYHIEYVARTRVHFKQALIDRQDQQQVHQQLLKLATQPELLRGDKYNDVIVSNNHKFRLLLIDTFNSLSKKQQRKFRKRLQRYADDFSELAEQETH